MTPPSCLSGPAPEQQAFPPAFVEGLPCTLRTRLVYVGRCLVSNLFADEISGSR